MDHNVMYGLAKNIHCPRCGGQFALDSDTYGRFLSCLSCGNEINPTVMDIRTAKQETASTIRCHNMERAGQVRDRLRMGMR